MPEINQTEAEREAHHQKIHRRFVISAWVIGFFMLIGIVYQVHFLISLRQSFSLINSDGAAIGPAQSDNGGTTTCSNCLSISNNNSTLTLASSSRFSIFLPSAQYNEGDLTVSATPADMVGEVFGAEPPTATQWVRTFQVTGAGTATITVPANASSTPNFTIQIIGQ